MTIQLTPFVVWTIVDRTFCKLFTLRDFELKVGDFTLDLAELYEVLISDMLLLSSFVTTVSQAVEY